MANVDRKLHDIPLHISNNSTDSKDSQNVQKSMDVILDGSSIARANSGNKQEIKDVYTRIRRGLSLDSNCLESGKCDGKEMERKSSIVRKSSVIRRKLARNGSRKGERSVERNYGNDLEDYKKIKERVLSEKAVVNAIEALQERWRMLIYMYEDCMDLVNEKKERDMYNKKIRRQEEIVIIILYAAAVCLPVSLVILFWLCRR